MHVILRQFAQERFGGNAEFRAERAALRDLAIGKHAPSNGEWNAGIERARADAPTTVRQDNYLVDDFYLLIVCHAASNDTQHIAVLRLDLFNRGHFEQARKDFTRGNLCTAHIDGFVAAKAEVNQEFEFSQKIAGKGDFEGDVANAFVFNREREDHLFLAAQGRLRMPRAILENLRLFGKFIQDGANRVGRDKRGLRWRSIAATKFDLDAFNTIQFVGGKTSKDVGDAWCATHAENGGDSGSFSFGMQGQRFACDMK